VKGPRQPVPAAPVRHRTPSSDVSTALLVAAEDVLDREGLAGLTIRAVATEAGVAPMGVYNRFGGKPGLIDALLSRGFVLLREAVLASPGIGLERLRNSGPAYREFALTHQHLYGLMFTHPHDIEPSEDAMANAVQSFQALVLLISDAMNRGELAPADAVEVAQSIWSAVHGAVSLELAGIGFTADPAQTFERMNEAMIAGFTHT
jgi:AcrR family transcriptional regulator